MEFDTSILSGLVGLAVLMELGGLAFSRVERGELGILSTSEDMSNDTSDSIGLKVDDDPEEAGLEEVPIGDGVEGRRGL